MSAHNITATKNFVDLPPPIPRKNKIEDDRQSIISKHLGIKTLEGKQRDFCIDSEKVVPILKLTSVIVMISAIFPFMGGIIGLTKSGDGKLYIKI